jgi:hypothetical protein
MDVQNVSQVGCQRVSLLTEGFVLRTLPSTTSANALGRPVKLVDATDSTAVFHVSKSACYLRPWLPSPQQAH